MGLEEESSSSCGKRMEISIEGDPSMFPGFRFSPTDEELISYYLKKKLQGTDNCVDVIPEIEIWKYEPWDLPAKAVIQSENEWFFFSPRGRKYPNGSQSRRATESGYWKATGKERNVKSVSNVIGTKRTLVFHIGRAPKGQRTEWLMHEFCMLGNLQDSLVVCRLRKNADFHLTDNSSKRSTNGRQLQCVDDYATSSAIGHHSLAGLNHVGECSSKEGSASFNSNSVEQTDSGYESDNKVPSEFSRHCSRLQRGGNTEEDCFADIMKDDIIKLDESSFRMVPELSPIISREFESRISSKQPVQDVVSQVVPFQGTANRRLRLRKPKEEIHRPKYLICKQNRVPNLDGSLSQKFKTVVGSLVSNTKTRRLVVYSCLGMVIMVVMCICLLAGFRQLKDFITCSP
ncbi:hypothetical protein LIER_25010 [Lithospermum erythrorhizon]|uniref:NAC domain-containing protein n=1 Tax=Lithospermum erythrorhizon TaxID=34254 RepID=A0AAV3R5C8_LITER